MKSSKRIAILILCAFFEMAFTACGGVTEQGMEDNSKEAESTVITYEQITQKEAKSLMETESGYVILDVRTPDEYAGEHILNAINIDYEEIEKRIDELPDKNQLILVYCRSGRRSKIAAETLANLGYTNVKEFGGIIDWEYGKVK